MTLPESPPPRAGRPAVVFAGGVGVPARKWGPVVERLDGDGAGAGSATESAASVSWIVADRPGLGRRTRLRLGDAPAFADEVARLAHDLRRCREAGASPVILVAHSAAGFLAEGVARSNPGLVDGVLLLDVSVVDDARRPIAVFRAVSHALGLLIEPFVRWAWPGMRRGEVSSLLLENAVFDAWARDLRELRAVDAAVGNVGGSNLSAANAADPASAADPAISADPISAAVPTDRADRSTVVVVTDVVAVPKRRLRGGVSAADVVAAQRGRANHLRTWRGLSGSTAAEGGDAGGTGDTGGTGRGEGHGQGLREVIIAPCPHMVMTRRPGDVAGEITALIARTGPRTAP